VKIEHAKKGFGLTDTKQNNMTENHKAYMELYKELIERGNFTRKELELACDLMGRNIETLNACMWSRYGARSIKDL